MTELFLRLDSGEEKGRIFKVTSMGMRLGRSSSNDIHVTDEELSRNHCLFELTALGELNVTDLASANGTRVNGESIGAKTKTLNSGDIIEVGNTTLTVVDSDKPKPIEMKLPQPESKAKIDNKIDLGLQKEESKSGDETGEKKEKAERPMWLNFVWFGVALLMILAAVALLMVPVEDKKSDISSLANTDADAHSKLKALEYEKIDADSSRIFRYHIVVEETGKINLELDDVPAANRHVRKSSKLADKALVRLSEMLASDSVKTLEKEYAGESSMAINELKSFKLSFNIDGLIKECYIENAPEPEAFRELRENLETFVNNELGIWSIQYPKEKLLELSFGAYELGESKWDERDVEFGNVAIAIKAFNESIFYLDTINPKPEWFNKVRENLRTANDELNKRYKEQLFKADRAINTSHWEDAKTELRLLMEMIPDPEDERHKTAERKLLDVTNRIKGAR